MTRKIYGYNISTNLKKKKQLKSCIMIRMVQNLGPIRTFIGYKQTNRHPEKQCIYIDKYNFSKIINPMPPPLAYPSFQVPQQG